MANPRHDRRTGRFVSAALGRAQSLQGLAELTDQDWTLDEEALAILEAGVTRAIHGGWVPRGEWALADSQASSRPASDDPPGRPAGTTSPEAETTNGKGGKASGDDLEDGS